MTTTTERIAQAVAPIIAETMREYRERCAQLEVSERLTRAAHDDRVRERDEALATIDDLNRQLDEAHKENARLVMENKRLSEYASGNWVDVPPPSDAGCLYPECGPTCRRDCPPAPADETPAVKQEEQGPWVVQSDGEYLCYDNRGTTRHIEDAYKFDTRAEAQERMCLRERVITLAEARAIEAKRNG